MVAGSRDGDPPRQERERDRGRPGLLGSPRRRRPNLLSTARHRSLHCSLPVLGYSDRCMDGSCCTVVVLLILATTATPTAIESEYQVHAGIKLINLA
jgi:hypothetical protein